MALATPLHGGPHDLPLAAAGGTLVLRVLVTGGVFLVAAYAVLRPFLPERLAAAPVVVTGAAAGAGLLLLPLADGLDGPRQLAVALLAALAVPLLAAGRQGRAPALVAMVRRAAPWALTVAAVGAALELGRAWLVGGDAGALSARLFTGVLLALAGLSWSVWYPRRPDRPNGPDRPNRPGGRAALHGTAGVLAAAAVAATVHLELLAATA
jgi:hypothetical protein